MNRRGYTGILILASVMFLSACQSLTGPPAPEPVTPAFIDTHAHLNARHQENGQLVENWSGAVAVARGRMARTGAILTLLAPPPFPAGHHAAYDLDAYHDALGGDAAFGAIGGGGRLNPFIHAHAGDRDPDAAALAELKRRANAIVRGGARGFGELTALHLSFQPWHPYLEIAPDHPLFLALADIAAESDRPVDLHMEAVSEDVVTPERFQRRTPNNPRVLKENIRAFERLLAHNRDAKIIWAHAGWDNTGHRTVALMRRLLETHSNLFMSIKVGRAPFQRNRPLDMGNVLRTDWLELLGDFPERFVIGSDEFHGSPDAGRQFPPLLEMVHAFLRQLPPDLARKIGIENPARIFGLSVPPGA